MRDFDKLAKCPNCGTVIYRTKYITIQEVTRLTGLHYNTVYRHREELGGVKRMGRWKFALAEVINFMNNIEE